jgi:predicted GIY-YIG superfamily endonuclease
MPLDRMRKRILDLIREMGPLTSQEIAMRIFNAVNAPPPLSDRIIKGIIGEDPAFLLKDGLWCVVEEEEMLGVPIEDLELSFLAFSQAQGGIDLSVMRSRGTEAYGSISFVGGRSYELLEEISNFIAETVPVAFDPPEAIRSIFGADEVAELFGIYDLCWISLKKLARSISKGKALTSPEALFSVLGIVHEERRSPERESELLLEAFSRMIRMIGEPNTLCDLLELQMPLPEERIRRLREKRELVRDLPKAPGVYEVIGEGGETIYVGKSKNIRRRVLSHLYSALAPSDKALSIAEEMREVRYEVVGSELEALLLEARRIRERRPRLNKQIFVSPKDRALRRRFKNLVLVMPSAEPGCAELFIVSEGRPIRQRRIGRDADERELAIEVWRSFGIPSCGDNVLMDEEEQELEIFYRWLEGNMDRVDMVNMDEVAGIEDAVRLIKQYLSEPSYPGWKVRYK